MYEVVLASTGDRAEAETLDGALLAAYTLIEDASGHYGSARQHRRELSVLSDLSGVGMRYDGLATTLAQSGRPCA